MPGGRGGVAPWAGRELSGKGPATSLDLYYRFCKSSSLDPLTGHVGPGAVPRSPDPTQIPHITQIPRRAALSRAGSNSRA